MATLLIGDNEFNGKIVCDGQVNTECSEFINYGDGVDVTHLYVSAGYISESLLTLYRRPIGSAEWSFSSEWQMGGYHDYAWRSITINVGNYEYRATYKGLTKYYTVASPCTPNWQCETPLNGYEEDGCGNRRSNENCVDQCIDVICPDICVDTDLWYQKCDPVTGNCVLDKIHFNAAEECGAEPIIICRKGCIPDTFNYLTGNRIDDECEVIENSELCGYVTPDEPPDNSALVTYGVIGLAGAAALIGLILLRK